MNPARPEAPTVDKFGSQFRVGDKVIQTENNYDKEVFNGDIGQIVRIDAADRELMVRYDDREVPYDFNELDEIALAYAVTIHKSQGSEYPVVVIPMFMQHYLMLSRNLLYTGLTRARKLVILVGSQKAIGLAVKQVNAKTGDTVSRFDSTAKEAVGEVSVELGQLGVGGFMRNFEVSSKWFDSNPVGKALRAALNKAVDQLAKEVEKAKV